MEKMKKKSEKTKFFSAVANLVVDDGLDAGNVQPPENMFETKATDFTKKPFFFKKKPLSHLAATSVVRRTSTSSSLKRLREWSLFWGKTHLLNFGPFRKSFIGSSSQP